MCRTRRKLSVSLMFVHYIFTSSVIYYRTDPPQHGIHLFYIIKSKLLQKKLFLFQNLLTCKLEGRRLATLVKTKKAIVYKQNEAISLLAMVWVAMNCDMSRKITPLSNLTRALHLVTGGMKLTAKAELNREIYKS